MTDVQSVSCKRKNIKQVSKKNLQELFSQQLKLPLTHNNIATTLLMRCFCSWFFTSYRILSLDTAVASRHCVRKDLCLDGYANICNCLSIYTNSLNSRLHKLLSLLA